MKYVPLFLTAAVCAAFLSMAPAAAEDFTSKSGKVFKNYRILKSTEQGVMISHSEGVAYLIYSDLPDEVAGPYSPDLKLPSGRVLKKYSVSEVTYRSFRIKHDAGTEWISCEDLPAWLLKKHSEEVEEAQGRFIDEAVKKIPQFWDFDEAFVFFEKNAAALAEHPRFGELKSALADFAVEMMQKTEDFEDGAAIFEMAFNAISGHPKAEVLKNVFAGYAIKRIRNSSGLPPSLRPKPAANGRSGDRQ